MNNRDEQTFINSNDVHEIPRTNTIKIYSKDNNEFVLLNDQGVESVIGNGGGGVPKGDMFGPNGSNDNNVAFFDGITGKLLKNNNDVKYQTGFLIAPDLETSYTFSLNDDLKKIENITSGGIDITNINGKIKTTDIEVRNIYDTTGSILIALDETSVNIGCTELNFNGVQIATIDDIPPVIPRIEILEQKTQYITTDGVIKTTSISTDKIYDYNNNISIDIDPTTVNVVAPYLKFNDNNVIYQNYPTSINALSFIKTNGTNIQYLMANGSTLTASANSGNSNYYLYNNSTVLTTTPSNGNVNYNSSSQSTATIIYISHRTRDNIDIEVFFKQLSSLTDVYIQDQETSLNYIQYNITGTPVITPEFQVAINVIATTGAGTGLTSFGNGHNILVSFFTNTLEVDTRISNLESKTQYQLSSGGNTFFSGTLIANFVKTLGGLSTEFLKANGTLDSNTYATTAITNALTTRTQNLESKTTFMTNSSIAGTNISGTLNVNDIRTTQIGDTGGDGVYITFNTLDIKLYSTTLTYNDDNIITANYLGTLNITGLMQASGYIIPDEPIGFLKSDGSNDTTTATNITTLGTKTQNIVSSSLNQTQFGGNINVFTLKLSQISDGLSNSKIDFTNTNMTITTPSLIITAPTTTFSGSIVKSGGTLDQFLKANGSVDDNNYTNTQYIQNVSPSILVNSSIEAFMNGTGLSSNNMSMTWNDALNYSRKIEISGTISHLASTVLTIRFRISGGTVIMAHNIILQGNAVSAVSFTLNIIYTCKLTNQYTYTSSYNEAGSISQASHILDASTACLFGNFSKLITAQWATASSQNSLAITQMIVTNNYVG